MSVDSLLCTRAEILAVSHASASQALDRAGVDAAICVAIHRHGGVRGCVAALAQEFGEHPETAAPRMRWAKRTVTDLYPPACVPTRPAGPGLRLVLRVPSPAATPQASRTTV
jgi:hypothetical protein